MIIIIIIWTKHAIGDSCPGVHVHCTIEYHNYLVVTEGEGRKREDKGREKGGKREGKGRKKGGK